MTTQRVLIIGGAGFLGSALTARLRDHGATVTILDSYQQFADPETADHTAAVRYRANQREGCNLVRGDARNVIDLMAAFDITEPTHVVHMAAVARAPLNDQLAVDAISTASLSTMTTIQLAARHQVERVLLVSSSYVYGDFRYIPCDEAHPTEPRTIYGAAKLTAEIIGKALADRLDVPLTIARLIAVYGPRDLNGKLCVQNLREAAQTGHLPISGGTSEDAGTDYTHIDDAVQGLHLALAIPDAAGQTLNISRGRARTATEVASALTRLGIPTSPAPERVGPRPRRGALDITGARQLLGFEPVTDIEEGLRDCLAAALDGDHSASRRGIGRAAPAESNARSTHHPAPASKLTEALT